MDNGSIIASERCKIAENDTSETLFKKVEDLAIDMFRNCFGDILLGVENFIEPDKDFYYYGIDSNKDLKVAENLSFEEKYDFVRAWSFKNRPKPFISKGDYKIYLSIN